MDGRWMDRWVKVRKKMKVGIGFVYNFYFDTLGTITKIVSKGQKFLRNDKKTGLNVYCTRPPKRGGVQSWFK